MTPLTFAPAVKTQAKLRLAIEGGPGTGKTFTSLRIARGLVASRIALIDTEAGSASKYADLFGFDTLVMTSYEPQDYVDALTAAEAAGYELVVIDSLSHEWQAVKQDVDRRKTAERNQFAAWKEPKAAHERLVEKIVQSRLHVIATMRSKVEYAIDNSSGRAEIKRLGMAPIQQDEMPFHFDVIGAIDTAHNMTISKSRIAALADKVIEKPGEELGKKLAAWLAEGAPAPVAQPSVTPTAIVDGMTPETRSLVENALLAAKSTDLPRYEHAAAALKGYGFRSLSSFLSGGTEAQAQTVLADLTAQVAEPVSA